MAIGERYETKTWSRGMTCITDDRRVQLDLMDELTLKMIVVDAAKSKDLHPETVNRLKAIRKKIWD